MNRRGNAAILVAVGMVTFLAATSLAIAAFAAVKRKQVARRLDRLEAFYGAELAAWSAVFRSSYPAKPCAARERDDAGRCPIVFRNSTLAGAERLPPGEPYIQGAYEPGTPLTLLTTSQHDPGTAVIQRPGDLRYRPPPPKGSRTYCGMTELAATRGYHTVCVAETKKPHCVPGKDIIDLQSARPGSLISDQYSSQFGVVFELGPPPPDVEVPPGKELDRHPFLAEAGGIPAFFCDGCTVGSNQIKPGERFGRYFLTNGGGADSLNRPLRIKYTRFSDHASGVLADIDGGKAFLFEVMTRAGIRRFGLGPFSSADKNGRGTWWSIDEREIIQITISAVGATKNVGVALDNFAPHSNCAPDDL